MEPLEGKNVLSRQSDLGPTLSPAWLGRDQRRPALARPRLAKLQEHIQHENEHILIIRTPFSMFLGSLESQRKALQEFTEKHHNPTRENKTKWVKVKPPYKR